MNYVIDPPAVPSLPVIGEESRFPVHRIYCVGRNYAAHAIEMGHDPDREPPFFFTKPADTIVPSGSTIPYPLATADLHHEIELVVALREGGVNIPAAEALDRIYGYAVGIDLTRRDLQGEAKKLARPWCAGKAFDRSAPCTAIRSAAEIGHPDNGRIWLAVNGELRQEGDLNQLIWKIPEMIEYLSGLFELAPGDLIFTGTPAGVGAVAKGDAITGGVEGVTDIEIRIS
ncbi:MAG: fumarylacetoacetate hydrolase family protein [Rhodospirillales bacterium]|nr:MAG: fumarylacetoacetate hydrolase family protein [Rhodospirillales bacterium]